MDAKEAVGLAKAHIRELYAEEEIADLGLEEIQFDDRQGVWSVTLGFSRPWDRPRNPIQTLAPDFHVKRTYKTLRIANDTKLVLAVMSREVKV